LLNTPLPDLTAISNLTSVGFLGTSYYAAAGPSAYMSHADNSLYWYPGNGFTGDGVTPQTPEATIGDDQYSSADTGVICQIFRQLAKAGYYPASNANNNRAVSGGTIATATSGCLYQCDSFGTLPQLVFINVGTNEVVAGIDATTFITSYKQLLQKLANKGVKFAVLQTVLALSNNPTYAASSYLTRLKEYNAAIKLLSEWVTEYLPTLSIIIDDVFPIFGGDVPNATLFRVADIHPNSLGSAKLGISAGSAAVKLLG